MRKMMIAFGLIAAVLVGITYAYAQGPGFGPGPRGVRGQECWGPGKGLNLTPEQKAKFQELRQQFRSENAQLIGAIVAKRLELGSLWSDPKADSKAILDKEKELRDLQNQLKDKRVQSRLEARKILTPAQLAEFGFGRGRGRGFCDGEKKGSGQKMGPGMGPGMGRGYRMWN